MNLTPPSSAAAEPASVVFCVDANLLAQVRVTITSIVDNLAPGGAPLNFYVLFDGPESEATRALASTSWAPHRLELRYCENLVANVAPNGHLTKASLLRLYMPIALPELARAVYLDADLIVLADIRDLYGLELCGKPLGAVLDLSIAGIRNRESILRLRDIDDYLRLTLGIDPDRHGYFNTGVLLMDLAALRALDFSRRAAAKFEANPGMRWMDQCVINALIPGDIAPLDPRWNAMQAVLQPGGAADWLPEPLRPVAGLQRREPKIVHFIGMNKPWTARWTTASHELWWHYARRALPDDWQALPGARTSPLADRLRRLFRNTSGRLRSLLIGTPALYRLGHGAVAWLRRRRIAAAGRPAH